MLPTFSGRATHLRTLTPSLPYAKQSTPDVQNEPKRSGRQSESGLRMGLERRQGCKRNFDSGMRHSNRD